MAFVRRCLNIDRKRWVVQQTSLSTLTKAHLGKWGRSVVWEVDANDNNPELTSQQTATCCRVAGRSQRAPVITFW